jgi:hypothetical protein
MTIRTDFSVDYLVSPRIITIAAPSLELTIQDLIDTIRDIEDNITSMGYPKLLNASGKEPLGGGVFVGITASLQNALIAFEARPGPAFVQALVNGGNLVSFDSLGDPLFTPIETTAFVQVILTSSSSATLQNQTDIEYSSFGGGVSVDQTNGVSGTVFPAGTPRQPSNNFPDAKLIADNRGFTQMFIVGNATLDTGDDVRLFTLKGVNANRTVITVNPASLVADVQIVTATVSGSFDVKATFKECILLDIQFVEALIQECVLAGTITLAGTGTTSIFNSGDGIVSAAPPPEIDFGGSGRSLALRGYEGDIKLLNKTGPEAVEINMDSGGQVILDSTVTNGTIRLTGTIDVVDNTTGTAIVDTSAVIFPSLTQLAAFNGKVYIDVVGGAAGVKFPQGTNQNPVNNLADAKIIMSTRMIGNIVVQGTLVIGATDVIDGFELIGAHALTSVVVITAGASTASTGFKNMILAGTLGGAVFCDSVAMQALVDIGSNSFPSVFERCIFRPGTFTFKTGLTTPQNIHFIECVSGEPGAAQIIVDVNGTNSPFAFRKYDGGVTLRNISAGNQITVDGDPVRLTLDASCTSGTLVTGGTVSIVDNSGVGFTVVDASVVSQAVIADAVWDEPIADHSTVVGSIAEFISKKLLTVKKFVGIRIT